MKFSPWKLETGILNWGRHRVQVRLFYCYLLRQTGIFIVKRPKRNMARWTGMLGSFKGKRYIIKPEGSVRSVWGPIQPCKRATWKVKTRFARKAINFRYCFGISRTSKSEILRLQICQNKIAISLAMPNNNKVTESQRKKNVIRVIAKTQTPLASRTIGKQEWIDKCWKKTLISDFGL